MEIRPYKEIFSFHDSYLKNIEITEEKIIVDFSQVYLSETDELQDSPRLILERQPSLEISHKEMDELIKALIEEFDPEEDLEGHLTDPSVKDRDQVVEMPDIEIFFYRDGKYRAANLEELNRANFELVSEAYGYGYIHFRGNVVAEDFDEDWAMCSLDIYFSGQMSLEF